MSKKKNTLKDLDAFLKQQAATIVPPETLQTKVEETTPKEATPAANAGEKISPQNIIQALKNLSQQEGSHFRNQLCDIIIASLDSTALLSPEDTMLINTALYLKGGDNWKELVREYWRNKKVDS